MRAFLTANFLLCLAFVFLWNSGYIAAKYVLPMAAPLTLLAWRYWALALILGGYLMVTGKLRWPGGKRAGEAMVIGVFAHGTWLGCVLYALEEGVPAGIIALVVALQPLLTGILSSRFVGERPSVLNWTGLVLGFIGVGVAVGSRTTFSGEVPCSGTCFLSVRYWP
ncbi:MAG: DMT family transporter [Opitutales bacterium]|nr:DMT family transporter [Opitutales bacterium]